MKRDDHLRDRQIPADGRGLSLIAIAGLIAGVILISGLVKSGDNSNSLLCSIAKSRSQPINGFSDMETQLRALVHYATSKITPQQNYGEISVTFDVLKKRNPCNFLVFGLGYDSLMWDALNPQGKTLFIEEDQKWVDIVLKGAPNLRAYAVKYRTQLKEAGALLNHYRKEPSCFPSNAYLRGNDRCRLALTGFPDEFYDTDWDLIMIDAPRGYFPEAPGRMAAIFSAAVMARNRNGSSVTHVFLHDVDRKVEKLFATEFLCKKYLVKSVGRLWHFEIPPADKTTSHDGPRFC
ncbi:hypothetical protein like AT1G67330 [Hibiscus trionum]|uniref:Polysaccharide biosynthesis domain-containing protein n=1 Tax=Hibiscus trionum TaxID=183268 RepID=A0A9W7M4L7_HIBTR|nr:hypothetical protein like AT1G67330 [Hibiscus trionum]